MSRRNLLLLLLAACALILGACGGSSSDDSVDEVLQKTFASDKKIESGRLGVELNADLKGVQGLNGPVRLRLSGPFESSSGDKELPKFDFTLAISTAGQSFTAGGVSTGDKGFVRFQNQAYSVSDELFKQFKDGYIRSQKESEANKGKTPTLGSLGVDPRAWLKDAKKAGEEKVGGVETIHITAGIDVPRLLDDVNRVLNRASSATGNNRQVPQQLTAKQKQQIVDAVESAAVDVYTGKDDKTLRKLDVEIRLRKTSQIQGGTVRFTLDLSDVNESQDIKAPANTKPLEELIQQLQGGTGGTGSTGSTGGGGSSSGGATPPSSSSGGGGATDEYTQCLQQAGSDLKKVQECAGLLK